MSATTYLATDAAAWLDRFMQTQAELMAHALFVTFGLGQLGAAAVHDPAQARVFIDNLRSDAEDIAWAGEQLARVLRSILANVEQNLSAGDAA